MNDPVHDAIAVTPLGQAGFRLRFGNTTVYIDPYLSDRVAQVEGPHLERLSPATLMPDTIIDADWVLITHEHMDHCDPLTLKPLSQASPESRFVCPSSVAEKLVLWGIAKNRIIPVAEGEWLALSPVLRVVAVPAAHPEIRRDKNRQPLCVGFIFDYQERRIYHAGDTSVTNEFLETVRQFSPIDIAFLPVNEHNYFREQKGIIGNMTLREAFRLAEELAVAVVVPMHWDMFEPNRVYREEIELLYKLINPEFELVIEPQML